MSSSLIILTVAILTAISCSILGVFLVLKNMSMLTDAISHTILLGIVLSFFVVKSLESPLLVLGATLMGLVTVYLVELITSSKLVKEDAAIGVVLSFLFSIAVILISKYTANVHLDIDAVLLGEIAFVPFYTMDIFGITVSRAIVYGLIICIINISFVTIFFKELKISIFDKALAFSLGLYPSLIHYLLMTLVSTTSVISFESVGAMLLISFMIGPPVSAYLISKDIKSMIFISIIIDIIASTIGYYIAIYLDISIAGMIAVVIGTIFLCVFIYRKITNKYLM
ncbi:metal ABC transporter permease [Streptobacillus moniliformis]|uniref:ABC-3 protein n=1 Tax=Streptobacillus moniliformis (strain ATCC 14647 / DSM 12112 / NCTC 10651 / 9901) TaxID=519441 RepID=D1AWN5_STRM9|nr:metal ABC transporter permease [Streptobacillus moniliformis]ACZ00711.1 ABC-3 protein [Streptobacillus moniliformis DSM 12112]AVL42890.1 metal ABC transporter permease [Streptobacillus moniliformis]QXW65469.1 metal ABC transporter permease [Streptobacillus moniliformis]SQA14161.1 Manganese transport system membrane protein mntB [Streptobacillus moniliformis]